MYQREIQNLERERQKKKRYNQIKAIKIFILWMNLIKRIKLYFFEQNAFWRRADVMFFLLFEQSTETLIFSIDWKGVICLILFILNIYQ